MADCTRPPRYARRVTTDGRVTLSSERDWWLRTLLVLQSPHSVFVHLRDDSDEAAEARQEPVTAIVFLAGIAGVLATTVAGQAARRPRDRSLDGRCLGGHRRRLLRHRLLLRDRRVRLGASLAGSVGSYRRARHVLAFASVPITLTLLVWPVRLSLYGTDVFRSGGADGDRGRLRPDRGRRRRLVDRPARDREPRARLELAARGRGDGSARCRPRARTPRTPGSSSPRAASRKAASSSRHRVGVPLLREGAAAYLGDIGLERPPDLARELRVLLHEPRRVPLVEAEEVVPDEHLAVGCRSCADPDRRHLEEPGDMLGDRRGTASSTIAKRRQPRARARPRRAAAPSPPCGPAP